MVCVVSIVLKSEWQSPFPIHKTGSKCIQRFAAYWSYSFQILRRAHLKIILRKSFEHQHTISTWYARVRVRARGLQYVNAQIFCVEQFLNEPEIRDKKLGRFKPFTLRCFTKNFPEIFRKIHERTHSLELLFSIKMQTDSRL